MIRCLRIVAFRRLLMAYVLNELAWAVGTLALSLLVYKRTGSAIGSAAFFLCSQFLPALVSPALVARLDRASVRVVLPVLYAVEAALFGVLAYLVHHFLLVPVLLLALADGAIAATARSLATAARIEILRPKDLLQEGNALGSFGFSGAFMLGPVIGGAVVAAGGTLAALLVNCGLFAVLAVFLAITALPGAKADPEGSVWSRLGKGLAHVRSDAVLGRLLIMQAIGLCIFTITIPVEVVYAQHTLHAGASGYGLLLGVWGGGAVFGSVVYARFRRRSAPVLIAGVGTRAGRGLRRDDGGAEPDRGAVRRGGRRRGQQRRMGGVAHRHPGAHPGPLDGADDELDRLDVDAGAGHRHRRRRPDRAVRLVARRLRRGLGGLACCSRSWCHSPSATRDDRRPERRPSVEASAEEAAISRGKSLV